MFTHSADHTIYLVFSVGKFCDCELDLFLCALTGLLTHTTDYVYLGSSVCELDIFYND